MKLKKLLLATRNKDKVIEIKHVLKDLKIEIISADSFENLPDVEEDQPTLEGNAIKKAQVLFEIAGIPTVADDTGLEVDFLKGHPGVRSSRYAGENATYEDNVNKLLEVLAGVPSEKRTARFRTIVAFCNGKEVQTLEGVCEGTILDERRGHSGFGYDSVFYVPQFKKTFAEMDLQQKNEISHRGLALKKFKELINLKMK
ncbi:MAG: RdgB/HAM1 family non-canonical purine NTP pyrophosphatase [Calditrichaeota bacterium]|nr:RdgB/HAM1 family non-canonical purine NTP pyrophosphatase [Calditrichota bacterium]